MTSVHSGSIRVQLQRWKGAVCKFCCVCVVYSVYAFSFARMLSLTVLSYECFKVLFLIYFNLSFYIHISQLLPRISDSFFSPSIHVCEYFVFKRGMNQCNVAAVFKCLLFSSTTFCPCSLLSHINALACMSLLCLTEDIKVK